jgi:glycine dehydrogenase
MSLNDLLKPPDVFARRHIGAGEADIQHMLGVVGVRDLDELVQKTVPASIQLNRAMNLPAAATERAALDELRAMAQKNKVYRSLSGHGVPRDGHAAGDPAQHPGEPGLVHAIHALPGEIAQGRLEALLNFQTMIADLTGLPIAGASLAGRGHGGGRGDDLCTGPAPEAAQQVLRRERLPPADHRRGAHRAESRASRWCGRPTPFAFDDTPVGVLGAVPDHRRARWSDLQRARRGGHAKGALVVVATDLLALTLLRPPGEWGADSRGLERSGSGCRWAIGGPHAAFMAGGEELTRRCPGASSASPKTPRGEPACRMALQTREQHIRARRRRATSAPRRSCWRSWRRMYAIYHGPRACGRSRSGCALWTAILRRGSPIWATRSFTTGVRHPARQARGRRRRRSWARRSAGHQPARLGRRHPLRHARRDRPTRRRWPTCSLAFGAAEAEHGGPGRAEPSLEVPAATPARASFLRTRLQHRPLRDRDAALHLHARRGGISSLAHAMIPLGSCTMKLNATSEMLPSPGPSSANAPLRPADQAAGLREMFAQLETWLAEITGFAAISLQPNAGSQGEYAGLLVIRAYHRAAGEAGRNVCLIPTSAHGTNPASRGDGRGLKVVVVACDRARATSMSPTCGPRPRSTPPTLGP